MVLGCKIYCEAAVYSILIISSLFIKLYLLLIIEDEVLDRFHFFIAGIAGRGT